MSDFQIASGCSDRKAFLGCSAAALQRTLGRSGKMSMKLFAVWRICHLAVSGSIAVNSVDSSYEVPVIARLLRSKQGLHYVWWKEAVRTLKSLTAEMEQVVHGSQVH